MSPKYLSEEKIQDNLPDMRTALDEIEKAISENKKIMVYGDYDVDGVTATTVMVKSLLRAGAKDVTTMLPDRFIDGYGMSERCVKRAVDEKVGLVITVDCGSNNAKVISELKERSIPTVVTDHHEIMGELPDAVAVVNPKRRDAGVSKKQQEKINSTGLIDLAGVGVAFMVSLGLVEDGLIPRGQEKWLLDLALIGTLCDSMTISKINRELTYYGMKVLKKTRRVGLKELMKAGKISKLNSEAIGFQIGPRLNAGGRMESAKISLNLLMTDSKAEAVRLASKLEELNSNRRNEQRAAIKEIDERMDDTLDSDVIVASGNWHEGVLGIIAGRLVEKYEKPAFVLSLVECKDDNGDGISDIYKGSGRSFGDFNLAEALKACSDTIYAGGGHAGACGIKILPEKIDDFRAKINDYYQSLKLVDQEKYLKVLPEFSSNDLTDFTPELLDEMEKLEPYGPGNVEPIFGLLNMKVIESRKVGADQTHLRMVVQDLDGKTITLVAFSAPDEWFLVEPGDEVDVTVQLMKNEWNGVVSVEGRILAIQRS